MDPDLFLADLGEKPQRLADSASLCGGDPWAGVAPAQTWVFLGMGSSHYANQVAAARLRSHGIPAVAELAGSDLLPRVGAGTTLVAVSASGGSAETLDAVRRLRTSDSGALFVALTNRANTELESLCDVTVPMQAARNAGSRVPVVQHTLALLLALKARVTRADVPGLLDQVAKASAYLLDNRDDWLPAVSDALLGPGAGLTSSPRRDGSARHCSRR